MAEKNSINSSKTGALQKMQKPLPKDKPSLSRDLNLLTPSEMRFLKEDTERAAKWFREKAWPELKKQ